MKNVRNSFQAILIGSMIICQDIYADDGLPNPSIRPQAQSKTVDISVDALYWYTSEAVNWSYTRTLGDKSAQSFNKFTFDWAPGFRIGLGYNMMHDQWDTQASYTWFQSKASDHVNGIVTSAFLPARLSLLEPFSEGKASINLHYNIFDWDLGRSFLVSKHLIFRPCIGFKGGWINQTIHSHWFTPNFLDLFKVSASENLKNSFQGGGPKAGITGKWCFGNVQKHYFSIIGQFEAGYLWGHWSIRDKFIDTFSTEIQLKTSDRNFGSFLIHSFFGFGWDCNFDRDQSHFGVKLGYEIEDWFNQFQIYSDTSGSQNNDLILQGLTLSTRFDF
jgi:hypothetical protein